MEKRCSFELFKSNVCHRLKEQGDIDFLIETLKEDMIRQYYDKKWYPESFYLLAMVDYISRENNVPICNDYDDLRQQKMQKMIYPVGILIREGNGRSTRIWLDQILKKELGKVVDWSKVDKDDYLLAMERSPIKDIEIKVILQNALTDQIDDREMFMKGVDHSYEYEGYHSYRTEDLIKNTQNKSKKTVSKNVIEKQEEEEQDEEIER